MSGYSALVLSQSPLAYWPMQETAGAVLADLGPHGLTGTLHNVTPGVDGPMPCQNAMRFASASNSYITLASPGLIPAGAGAFTWEAWFRMFTVDTVHLRDILNVQELDMSGGLVHYSQFQIEGRTTFGLMMVHDGNAGQVAWSGAVPAGYMGAWHHVAHTWNGSTSALYYDGVAQPLSSVLPFTTTFAPTLAMIGGTKSVGAGSPHGTMNGDLAHVAVYAAALSPSQVAAHYATGVADSSACNEVIRVKHGSGHICWEHDGVTWRLRSGDAPIVLQDGTTLQVYSGGALVFETPFPTLSDTPDRLLGQDPATGLPAFCPKPTVTIENTTTIYQVNAPAPAPAPIVGPTPQEVACGIALYCAADLMQAYNVLAALITSIFHNGLSSAAAFLSNDDLGKSVGEISETAMTTAASGLWGALATALVGVFVDYELGPLSPQAEVNVQKAIWDVLYIQTLTMPPDLSFHFNGATQSAWVANIDAHDGAFTVAQHYALTFLIQYYQPQFWQGDMLVGGQNHFSLCPLLAYT